MSSNNTSDASSATASSTSSRLNNSSYGTQPRQTGFIIEELSSESESYPIAGYSNNMTTTTQTAKIPDIFTTLPPVRDLLNTQTSLLQDQTVQECLPFHLNNLGLPINPHGLPHLDRKRHIAFLHKNLRRLPAAFTAADASRPWMFYWALAGLATMGESLEDYTERLLSTVKPIQHPDGGFGGGNGQMSHLAPTYAVLLSLVMVAGGDVSEDERREVLELVNRRAMWKWLGRLKQRDGGFQMSVGGEEDVRGAYCAMVIITLLDLPLDLPVDSPARSDECTTFLSGLPEWVARCQTFEGGISGRPDAEAHGAYAFCALACLCIIDDPHIVIPKYLDVPRLISWLSARQYAPEGGFAGRTNKLVDGCYSHWVGGCWPLLEACLEGPTTASTTKASSTDSLYSREGLIRYILSCCQDQGKRGGLRDKPSHNSDSYHTCYVLAGLSSAQHKWRFNAPARSSTERPETLSSAYQWTSEFLFDEEQIFDEEDRVLTLHPVFVIPEGIAEQTRAYFASKIGF
ncbi:Terpenoid cyclase/Protein prenyltransferase [Glarea lozoyensis ATCC 20868]|uniref:Protein farnesyltransferase subunit beta n=1 Tax=Glarea lozoyensis (strain ATCC 20868 / MF5171) TaxID=1116229 RepID=S3D4M4_GLAL2|nr:Terpenoid cyclase/Protein prenyltransferase [Glarea lozoyensis ATCC 20868]EPE27026.1 Terpenoid cyclase/Protein prenyltransferase [Glarea lozoyensis ATCC 20868]